MPINYDPNIKPQGKVYQDSFNFVDLPFAYLRLSWNNGNGHASKNEGAKYFGGFQRGEDDIQADMLKMERDDLPPYFTSPVEWLSDNGKTYMARSSRFVYAAPVICKDDWWLERGQTKKSHRLDFLVYLASVEKEVLIPWGPAVISAHGFSASAIVKAFQGWGKDTKPIRHEFAGDLDAMFFYNCVGTFGPTRTQEKAGESVYVPCQFNKPQNWTEALLEHLFVGPDVQAIVVDLQIQAAEWAADTKANRQKDKVPVGGETSEYPQPDDNIPFEPPF